MKRSALVGAAALGAVVVASARRVDAAWTAADEHDPNVDHDYLLPAATTDVVVTDDGARLAVTDVGSGPTVVLAHCWMGGREVWSPVAHRLLRSGHRVVLYDQRGHGSSTVGSEGFTIPRLGADLAAVLEHFDITDAVLAGHSMGGMTIMSLAAHHSEVLHRRARAIVLVSTAAAGLGSAASPAAERVLTSPLVDLAMRSAWGHALHRSVVGRTVRRRHVVKWRDVMVATAPEVRAGWLRAMRDMDLREGLATIAVPVSVLVGTHDKVTPAVFAEELVERIPAASLRRLDGFGHTLPFEAPAEVAESITTHV